MSTKVAVLEALAWLQTRRAPVSAVDMAGALGLCVRRTRRFLADMEETGFATRIGSGKSTRWAPVTRRQTTKAVDVCDRVRAVATPVLHQNDELLKGLACRVLRALREP